MSSQSGAAVTMEQQQQSDARMARQWVAFIAAVLLLQVVSYLPMIRGEFRFNSFNRDDSESYLCLTYAMAHGLGYTRSLDPEFHVPHTHFPPGLPALMLPCAWAGNLTWLPQVVMVLFALANTVLLGWLARDLLGPVAAAFVVVMFSFSPVQDRLATLVMTEHPTISFGLLAVLALHRWIASGYKLNAWLAIACASLGFGLLVKGMLLAIVPAAALAAWSMPSDAPLRRRLSRMAVALSVGLLPFALWTARCKTVDAPGYDGLSHIDEHLAGQMQDGPIAWGDIFGKIVLNNVKWHVPSRLLDAFGGAGWFAQTHLQWELPVLLRVLVLLLAAVCVLGALLRVRQLGLVLVVLAATLVLLVTRYNGWAARFWTWSHPFMLICVVGGAQALWQRATAGRRAPARFGPMLAMGYALLVVLMLVVDHRSRTPQDGAPWRSFVAMARQLPQHVPADAAIVTHNPHAVMLISGIHHAARESDLRALSEGREPSRPLYLLAAAPLGLELGARDYATLLPDRYLPLKDLPGRREQVFANEHYVLMRMLPGDAR